MIGTRLGMVALAIATTGLAACSDDKLAPTTTAPSSAAPPVGSPSGGDAKSIVIKTRFTGFDGEVLDGSLLDGTPFCPGGTLHHEAGSPDIGHPAINVFTCGDSVLKIGFGPGPDQMDNRIQTSDWDVLEGSGDFAGASGSGTMKVEFPKTGASSGRETFIGTVVVP